MLIRDTDGIRIMLLRVVSSAYKIKLKYSVQLVVNEIGRNNCIVISTRVLVIVEISSPMLSSVIAILNQPKWQSTYKKTCIIEFLIHQYSLHFFYTDGNVCRNAMIFTILSIPLIIFSMGLQHNSAHVYDMAARLVLLLTFNQLGSCCFIVNSHLPVIIFQRGIRKTRIMKVN